MLIVRFCGGLGNQMYQYAFMLKLKKMFPECEIKKDVMDYRLVNCHNGYEIENIFQKLTEFPEASWREVGEIRGEIPICFAGKAAKAVEPMRTWINKQIGKKKTAYILDEREIDAEHLKEHYGIRFQKENFYLEGFWANMNLYLEEEQMLRENFRFSEFQDTENSKIQKEIQSCNSVSVHVRRGDYVGTKFDVLTEGYYRKAIEEVESKVENPVFYFFSDDTEYIEKNFAFIKEKRIVSWNRGKQSWKDMQLMSCCRHNITANSTFSQWGAMLNGNEDKIVIYPNKQLKNEDMMKIHLSGWKMIEV